MAQPVFRRNDVVEVFYRMGRDEGGNYFPVATPSAGTLRPRFGRTDGWMTARIEEDWPPTEHGERPSSTSSRVRTSLKSTSKLPTCDSSSVPAPTNARELRGAGDGRG